MAYDPNDPADKAIVEGLIAEALTTQTEEHEAEVTRLTNKNTELLGKLKKAREGGDNIGEIGRLESELESAQSDLNKANSELREAQRNLKAMTTERDKAQTERDSERQFAHNEFANNRLTAEFASVNVAPQFIDDLTASMTGKVIIKETEGKRDAFVGDKTLCDFVKEWAASDKGKHYIQAPANGGGGSQPNSSGANGGAKKISEMTLQERNAHFNAVGKTAFEEQLASEKK